MRHLVVALPLALVASLVLGGCQTEDAPSVGQQAIVGGAPAGAAYPAIGLLVDLSSGTPAFICTGTLIASDAVLTAAHCLQAADATTIGFALRSTISGATAAAFIRGKDLAPNTAFVGDEALPVGIGQANDIGVLTLATPITNVAPMLLVRPSEEKAATAVKAKLVAVGAGRSVAANPASFGVLRQATISIADAGEFELDVALPNEAQPCFGDSGGPLLYDVDSGGGADYRVVGVISRTANPFLTEVCDDGAIATRVDAYVDWIVGETVLPCGSGFDSTKCPDAGTSTNDGGKPKGDGAGTGTGTSIGPGPIIPKPDSGCAVAASSHPVGALSLWLLLALGLLRRRRSAR